MLHGKAVCLPVSFRLYTIIQVKSTFMKEMVWLRWILVIYVDLINFIMSWSKNGPQDRNADEGSLGR